ncbi:Pimeloyl-ACP methyl ester carboxylesterase [Filimonas lacunae]|uniref:Pimeloyl-ACP methyl ester carboxylesterase n=1 Tax=Filimonas lacunae TaxID=477680 RepID=A0A173MFY6_9BACT|nr:alpha/beta hydrolase [Filimonas lacunae]BAV06505.1 non-heme chloroperoxidase [Filimonas lacunae]SIT27204.1 Pimeloyl-ACP methyl ester carboxylesterase [Filimonas lacunae]
MSFITINNNIAENETVHLHYEDVGFGQPIVFVHGWPLSGDMWEYQVTELIQQGFRCITYDRRGFGKSSRPWTGYDYDTLTEDLYILLETLQLEDVVLVGFSMGGGEVARYFGKYGGKRVSKVVLASSVTPYMLKTSDNPEGADKEIFDKMLVDIKHDRIAFLDSFGKQFFSIGMLNHPVSTPLLEYYRTLASLASPIATQQCAISFASTDFRKDVQAINVPVLIIHGDDDKTVPIEVSGRRTHNLLPDAQMVVYKGGPHGLFYTHKDALNKDLVSFIHTGVAEGEPQLQPVGAFDNIVGERV